MAKRRWRWRKKWPLFLIALLLVAGMGTAYCMRDGLVPVLPGSMGTDLSRQPYQVNVLLLGVDSRKGEPSTRTDSMILVSVNTSTERVTLLSIPRDSRVDIPGHGLDKINDACVYGGPELSMQVVSQLLDVPVDYYVLTNFQGFKDIVDTLGGITIDVKHDMYHYDPMDGGIYSINLKKGVQHMNGTEALEYVRFRDDPTGDIARTERQQEFLAALAEKMFSADAIPKLPELVPEIMKNVQTNLPFTKLLSLAKIVLDLHHVQIVRQTLPGSFITIDGISYWGVDTTRAKEIMQELANGDVDQQVIVETSPGSGQSTANPSPSKVTGTVYGSSSQTGNGTTPGAGTNSSGSTTSTDNSQNTQGSGSSGAMVEIIPQGPAGTGTTTGTDSGATGTSTGTYSGTTGGSGTTTGTDNGTTGGTGTTTGTTGTSTGK